MPFLYKESEINKKAPIYSIGLSKTIVVAGLGNPGSEYDGTRHNLGFDCLDAFVESSKFDPWINKKDLFCSQSTGKMGDTRVIAIKPATFMNLSGKSIQAVLSFYKVSLDHLVVIHDELDIPFGQIKTKIGGSSAGHNGVDSIIGQVGGTFARIRVGIGPKNPPEIDSAKFVLAKFNQEELNHIPELANEVTAFLNEYIFGTTFPQETRNVIF